MISPRSLVLAGVLAVVLPSHAGLFSDDDARKSIYDLRADFLQYKTADEARLSRIETNIDTLQQASNRLQQSIDRLDLVLRNINLPSMQSQMDAMGADIAKLNGAIEMQTNLLQQDQKRSKEFYLDLDSRLRAIEKTPSAAAPAASSVPNPPAGGDAVKLTTLKKEEATTPPEATVAADAPSKSTSNPPTAPSPQPPSANEQKAYDQAYQAFKASNFMLATKSFQGFIKTYPRSVLSPNAGFWLGMSQYRLKAYTAAEAALKGVILNYPDSPKAPDALLNLASVQLDAGDANAAHDSLEDLIAHYPASEAAAKAKARLGRK